jgi:hypothetical protein
VYKVRQGKCPALSYQSMSHIRFRTTALHWNQGQRGTLSWDRKLCVMRRRSTRLFTLVTNTEERKSFVDWLLLYKHYIFSSRFLFRFMIQIKNLFTFLYILTIEESFNWHRECCRSLVLFTLYHIGLIVVRKLSTMGTWEKSENELCFAAYKLLEINNLR